MRSLAFLLALPAALLLSSSTALADPGWAWPVHGPVLTKYLNGGDPYASGQHRGIDIGADVGTPVVAATAGTVVYAGVVGSSGLTVAERAGDYELSYLHLSSIAVRAGSHVEPGERLGAVGVSGARSIEQPHLHFGVRQAADRHAYLDPLRFLPAPPAPDPAPQPAPVPVHDPVAAPAPVGMVPVPAPLADPVAAPASSPVLAHAPAPGRVRARQPVASPAHVAVAGAQSVAAAHPASHPTAHRAAPAPPAATAAPAHGPAARLAAIHVPSGAHASARNAAGRRGGIDLGWLAACVGLVLAAVMLARPASRGAGRTPAGPGLTTLFRAAAMPARARARQ